MDRFEPYDMFTERTLYQYYMKDTGTNGQTTVYILETSEAKPANIAVPETNVLEVAGDAQNLDNRKQ